MEIGNTGDLVECSLQADKGTVRPVVGTSEWYLQGSRVAQSTGGCSEVDLVEECRTVDPGVEDVGYS